MIPYDDLVGALQNWRAKQGLPVAGHVAPTPGSGRTATPPAAPQPHAYAAEEVDEVDEVVEEHDYGAVEHSEDATSIGAAPQRGDYEENPTELASDSGRLRKQREDW